MVGISATLKAAYAPAAGKLHPLKTSVLRTTVAAPFMLNRGTTDLLTTTPAETGAETMPVRTVRGLYGTIWLRLFLLLVLRLFSSGKVTIYSGDFLFVISCVLFLVSKGATEPTIAPVVAATATNLFNSVATATSAAANADWVGGGGASVDGGVE